jgi:hypothetical protein
MGIDRESNVAANLQIGPTTLGMVRLYIETAEIELPLDFEPEEAEEIAEELLAAAERARAMAPGGKRAPAKPAAKPAAGKADPAGSRNGPQRGKSAGAGARTKDRR